VIEKSAKTGSYIYKTLNSYTGEVVGQRPAEDVFKMATSSQYSPGLIVNAKA
jgi:flagellar protein FlaG